ncbi:hypothetical protein BIWAKO_00315 [Bosea sp. BIWAKO-01]|nr:hypothetical protein BIWAKO_00315 [Bosea sp. BIWAKO-01]
MLGHDRAVLRTKSVCSGRQTYRLPPHAQRRKPVKKRLHLS